MVFTDSPAGTKKEPDRTPAPSASPVDKNTGLLSGMASSLSGIAESIIRLIKKSTTPDDVLVNYPQANILVATPTRPEIPGLCQ